VAHTLALLPSDLILFFPRCGMKVNMAPFYYLLERGVDPVAAYQRTYKRIMRDIEFRTWYRGQPLGDAGGCVESLAQW
jgi:hypothetical protein